MSKYIIWNPESPLPPTVVHNSRPEAIRVAGRMAGQNEGATFYVCKLMHSANKPKPVPVTTAVHYVDLEKDEECPF